MLLVLTLSWLLFFIAAWLFVSPSCVRLRHAENQQQCFENAFLYENKMTLFAIGTLLTSWVPGNVQEIYLSKDPKMCLVRKFYKSPDDFNVYLDSRLWYKSPICTNSSQEWLCQRQPVHNIVKCSENQHACADGTCISTDYLCDGKYDCLNSAEERNCTDICTKGT